MKTSIVSVHMITDKETEKMSAEFLDRILSGATADDEVVVVENQYDDIEEPYDDLLFENVDVHVQNNRNVGVAAAWDQGIGVSSGDYIVLMNNDCLPINDGWLQALTKRLEEPDVGICFPYSIRGDETIDQLAPRKDGFCFAFRKEVYKKTGPFVSDQPFKLGYYEDDDFYMKVQQSLGLKLVAISMSNMWHKGQGTSKRLWNDEFAWGIEQNKIWYEEKWGKRYCKLDEK